MSLESLDSTHLAVTSYQLYSVFKGQSMSNQSPLETTRFIKVNVIHCWQLHMVTEVPQNSLVSPSHKINYFRFLQYILNLCQCRDSLRPGPSLPQYWLPVFPDPLLFLEALSTSGNLVICAKLTKPQRIFSLPLETEIGR